MKNTIRYLKSIKNLCFHFIEIFLYMCWVDMNFKTESKFSALWETGVKLTA